MESNTENICSKSMDKNNSNRLASVLENQLYYFLHLLSMSETTCPKLAKFVHVNFYPLNCNFAYILVSIELCNVPTIQHRNVSCFHFHHQVQTLKMTKGKNFQIYATRNIVSSYTHIYLHILIPLTLPQLN